VGVVQGHVSVLVVRNGLRSSSLQLLPLARSKPANVDADRLSDVYTPRYLGLTLPGQVVLKGASWDSGKSRQLIATSRHLGALPDTLRKPFTHFAFSLELSETASLHKAKFRFLDKALQIKEIDKINHHPAKDGKRNAIFRFTT
jgi:hypothetical protein